MKLRNVLLSILLSSCAVLFAGGRASFAQEAPPPFRLLTFPNTDNALTYYFEFIGPVFAILHSEQFPVDVTVGGSTGLPTTGTVVFRAGAKEYPALYAGPIPGFPPAWGIQINILIPREEFNEPIAGYLRVCHSDGRCANSTGATLRRIGQ